MPLCEICKKKTSTIQTKQVEKIVAIIMIMIISAPFYTSSRAEIADLLFSVFAMFLNICSNLPKIGTPGRKWLWSLSVNRRDLLENAFRTSQTGNDKIHTFNFLQALWGATCNWLPMRCLKNSPPLALYTVHSTKRYKRQECGLKSKAWITRHRFGYTFSN